MNTIEMLNRERGITVLHITHNMNEAVRADRVIVINDGEVFLDDTPTEVFSRVAELQSVGLDVPQVTELMYELRRDGVDVPQNILDEKSCADILEKLLRE
jgi:energy-coupling factor transport system ATP-binding protein